MNDNAFFVRMSIASAHGERDFKLPSGEGHRLRIVEPLSDGQREALQSHPDSPAYVHDAAARKRIAFYAGNVLRTLTMVAGGLPTISRKALEDELAKRLERVHAAMQMDCEHWLGSVPEGQRALAAERSKELLAGKLSWRTAKGLFDAGIMFRTTESDHIHPVSAIAASAFLSAMASHVLRTAAATLLSSIADGRKRGFELEARVLARLSTVSALASAKLLDGTPSESLSLRSSYTLPFDKLEEVAPRDTPVLYQPLSLTFPCDGILMPATGDAEGAIVVLECSTQCPRDATRVAKVLPYLRPGGVVSVLAHMFPAVPRVVALVYDGTLDEAAVVRDDTGALHRGELPQGAVAESPAAGAAAAVTPTAPGQIAPTATADVRVLDRSSLVMLGGLAL
jgi:hypothetical protein